MKDFLKNYAYPVATLLGGIIGVGFLALPYIALKVGIFAIIVYFVVLTALMVLLHVIFGQVSLKTPDHKRFPGFVGFYLGRIPKIIILVLIVLASFAVMVVYLIVGGQFLTAMASPWLGGSMLMYVAVYFLVCIVVIYFGIKTMSRFEFWSILLLLVSLALIGIASVSQIKLSNIFFSPPNYWSGFKTMFLPYGAIIFSLWGIGLIPETEEMLKGRKHTLKRIIIIGTLLPAILYLLFIFLILGISGSHTTQSALIGLKDFLGAPLFFVALLVGLVSTFAAFVGQGILLKKTFMYDVGLKEFPAWALTCFIPLILFLLGFNSFIPLISFIGGFLLSIEGILILLMYKKIGGKNRIIYPLSMVFILGIIYEIIYVIH